MNKTRFDKRIVFAGACRTAGASVLTGIGGGGFWSNSAHELMTTCVLETLRRTNVPIGDVDGVVMGTCMHDPRVLNVGRIVAVLAGLPEEIRESFFLGEYLSVETVSNRSLASHVVGDTVSFNCGSGLVSIINAVRRLLLGEGKAYIAGGGESMSHAPLQIPRTAKGEKPYSQRDFVVKNGENHDLFVAMENGVTVTDALLHGLRDPFTGLHYGATADLAAVKYGITRREQDKAAVISHSRARKARDAGYFAPQIVPIRTRDAEARIIDLDEGIRTDLTEGVLASLKPYFTTDGTVTAATSALVSDGAASMLVMTLEEALHSGIAPDAEILDYEFVAGDPSYMGVVPILAIQKIYERWGFGKDTENLMHINNAAFEATNLSVQKLAEVPKNRWNWWGDAISGFGHAVGGSGAMRTVEGAYMLKFLPEYDYVLVSFCVGGGQAVALLIGRV